MRTFCSVFRNTAFPKWTNTRTIITEIKSWLWVTIGSGDGSSRRGKRPLKPWMLQRPVRKHDHCHTFHIVSAFKLFHTKLCCKIFFFWEDMYEQGCCPSWTWATDAVYTSQFPESLQNPCVECVSTLYNIKSSHFIDNCTWKNVASAMSTAATSLAGEWKL